MWAAEVAQTGGDNIYTLLGIVAASLLGASGALFSRSRKKRPLPVEPRRVAQQVVSQVDDLLKNRVKQLERKQVQMEREKAATQVRVEDLIGEVAGLRAELGAERVLTVELRTALGVLRGELAAIRAEGGRGNA